jgi:tryptophan synthase beta subunit
MGKTRIVAETGAGQHGVGSATAVRPARPRMYRLHGRGGHCPATAQRATHEAARVRKCVSVTSGSKTLKDAINEAIRDWVTNVETTHYLLGSVLGPHPYPMIVRDFQSVIGVEARQQMLAQVGRLPDTIIACVGGWLQRHGHLPRLPRG